MGDSRRTLSGLYKDTSNSVGSGLKFKLEACGVERS